MNEIKQKQVLFFRKGKNYYYKYGEKISKVDAWTINLLKESLTLPYNVGFIGYSRAQIGRIISYLYEDGVKVQGNKIDDRQKNHALHFIISFSEMKYTIDVFRIPYVSNFYGRSNNINPFTIINLNGKQILLEVTKDYAKKNKGDYYFLADELTDEEKNFFDSCYVKLEYDFLYRMQSEKKQIGSSKVFKRIKKR